MLSLDYSISNCLCSRLLANGAVVNKLIYFIAWSTTQREYVIIYTPGC